MIRTSHTRFALGTWSKWRGWQIRATARKLPRIRRSGWWDAEKAFNSQVVGYEGLVKGDFDSRLVKIRGRVRSADIEAHKTEAAVHMDVSLAGGEIQVHMASSKGFNPNSLLDADVEVTGVAGGAFDAAFQIDGVILYSTDVARIRILREPSVKLEQIPTRDMYDIFATLRMDDHSPRVRVHGVVTYYRKGEAAVLQQGEKSIYVQTKETSDLAIGDEVDAFGFADAQDYSPGLREAMLFKTRGRQTVLPLALNYEDAFSGIYSDRLIELTGTLVTQLHDVASDTLVVSVDGHLVNAELADGGPVSRFLPGSKIQVVGICRIVPGGPWRWPYMLSLKMRTGSDATLISAPSWFTVKHLMELLAVLLLCSLVVGGWALALRGRVFHQTLHIQRSMILAQERSRLLQKISSNDEPEVLLKDICECVESLLTGTRCTYYPSTDNALKLDRRETQRRGKDRTDNSIGETHAVKQLARKHEKGSTIFEVLLTSPDEKHLGRIVVSAGSHYEVSIDEEEVFVLLSELATLAVQQSLLHRSLVHHSSHDHLTGLPNRRLCEERLSNALDTAKMMGGRVAVIYVDIDQFKKVNDRYGHKVGDEYLQLIGSRLKAQLRATDTLARIGGDEFLVVSPPGDFSEPAETIAARLRACFDVPFELGDIRIQGAASFGLVQYPEDGVDGEELQQKADHAMYASKHRNKVRPISA